MKLYQKPHHKCIWDFFLQFFCLFEQLKDISHEMLVPQLIKFSQSYERNHTQNTLEFIALEIFKVGLDSVQMLLLINSDSFAGLH